MQVVKRKSKLWNYLPKEIQGLIEVGENLLMECHTLSEKVTDYSYLVFPFAKAYEGFLKNFFLDLELIKEDDFYGDDIRIGRILNPVFMEKSFSVYAKLKKIKHVDEDVPRRLWEVWKRGRNQVFHYFPHNFRRLSKEEAAEIVEEFIQAMEGAVALIEK
jgi:predicted CopG family antitoxin